MTYDNSFFTRKANLEDIKRVTLISWMPWRQRFWQYSDICQDSLKLQDSFIVFEYYDIGDSRVVLSNKKYLMNLGML